MFQFSKELVSRAVFCVMLHGKFKAESNRSFSQSFKWEKVIDDIRVFKGRFSG